MPPGPGTCYSKSSYDEHDEHDEALFCLAATLKHIDVIIAGQCTLFVLTLALACPAPQRILLYTHTTDEADEDR